jgi:hypothetical protein
MGRHRWCGLGVARSTPLAARFYHPTRRPVSLVVRCAQCREEVLEADLIGDEEECALRDHLLAAHPNTIQPETRSVLLRHFVVTEQPHRQDRLMGSASDGCRAPDPPAVAPVIGVEAEEGSTR